MRTTFTWIFSGFILLLCLVNACSKAPNIEEFLVGSWRIKRANIHSIQSYRHNGSWSEQERVEGKFSRIIKTKEKVEGVWIVEYNKDLDKLYIVITPSKVGQDEPNWVLNQQARFEVMTINKDELVLQGENGQIYNWGRVRSSQADDGEAMIGIALVNPGPIIVNLKMDRAQDKFRFMCLDMELSVEDAEGLDYLSIEKDSDKETATYHLHPVILDAAITYFSSQTYKDVKSLDKVREVVNEFKKVLAPYFEGRLTDIKVNKVVVTAQRESVVEFEKLYAELYGLAPPDQGSAEDQGADSDPEASPQ